MRMPARKKKKKRAVGAAQDKHKKNCRWSETSPCLTPNNSVRRGANKLHGEAF